MIPGVMAQAQDQFVTVWKTDNAGTSNPDQITLPLTSLGSASYDFWVDWGDGSAHSRITAWDAAAKTHTFVGGAGTYTVRIYGEKLRGWRFNNGGDKLKILQVKSWGRCFRLGGGGAITGFFYGCANLTVTAIHPLPSALEGDQEETAKK